MENTTSGEFEEFFDFERLDKCPDNEIDASCTDPIGLSPQFTVPQFDPTMEWDSSTASGPCEMVAIPPYASLNGVDYTPLPEMHDNSIEPLDTMGGLQYQLPVIRSTSNENVVFQQSTIVCNAPAYEGADMSLSIPADLPISQCSTQRGSLLPSQKTPIEKPKQPMAKRKAAQPRISTEAKQILEKEFAINPYPCSWEIDIIAHQSNLDVKRVRNWFNNTRARRQCTRAKATGSDTSSANERTLAPKLSWESLETLSKHMEKTPEAPQPPLETYLASSFQDEAATYSAIQAAIEDQSSVGQPETLMDSSTCSRVGRSPSVITSLSSSDGTAPTSFSMSSSGDSNVSSFGRDRRRGRRRMNWRTSPYNRTKMSPLNAHLLGDDLPFFCTFCPRSFRTKYEWTRHEDSVHALRTTWICCNTKQTLLQYCPFCGKSNPDDYHMSTHRYQQCKNKPETQRTFFRRDHFVQHLHHVHFANVKHPSERLGCQNRLTSGEGYNHGCKDLAMKWRKFGAPMRSDDPMLHCGFCGKRLKDWTERCEHIADHLIAGGLSRSAWWPERLENHLENLCAPQTIGPFRCRYCQKVFTNVEAINKHSHCRVWSCRFLGSFDDIASESSSQPLVPQFPSPKAHHCHLCGAGYRSTTSHVDHAHQYHNYRQCKQDLYSSEAGFLQHLHDFHGASPPPLLQHRMVIEYNFSRNKGASFEPVNFDEIMRGCRADSPSATFVDPFPFKNTAAGQSSLEEIPELDLPPPTTPQRRKPNHLPFESPDTRTRARRQTQEDEPITEPPGPRFFRLDPLVPFLASRIYYLRNAKMSSLFDDGKAILQEVPKGHIASLVMSSGLVGMAGVRMPVMMENDDGVIKLALDD